MSRAAGRLPHARPSAFDSEEAEAYRAELLAAVGAPFTRMLLTSSGSEAVDAAIKVAIAYHRANGEADRVRVRSLAGHYHGATLAALGVTGWGERRAPWADILGPRVDGLPAADDRSAAFIAETVPVAGLGVAMPDAGSLAARRAACTASGALWIADEVLTGFGRTGALFAWRRMMDRAGADGARPDAGAVPDLVVFGKGAGAGYAPLAGVLISDRVAAALDAGGASAFTHHQTYGGNPIACAVGRGVLRALAGEAIEARVRETEAAAGDALRAAAGSGAVVRGIGALWAVSAPGVNARDLHAALRDRDVLAHRISGEAAGSAGGVVIAPPLTAGAEEWNLLVSAIAEAAATAGATPSRDR